MKALEKFLAALCIISPGFQLGGLSGSAFLILISFLSLSTYYFVFGFAVFNSISFKGIFKRQSYQDTNALKIIAAVVAGISVATIVVGILYKLFSWSGAHVQIIAGVTQAFFIILVSAFRYRKSKSNYYLQILYRLAIFAGLGIVFFFY